MSLVVATRPSPLAVTQTGLVCEALGLGEEAMLKVVNESGPVDKERFVHGVEQAVLSGRADVGVHSAKDLPGVMTSGLAIAATPKRADARDAWVGPGDSVATIPEGSRVGTSSLRRQAQLLAIRPDLEMVPIAGNVDTRLSKLRSGEVDGLILAMAGLERLGRSEEVSFLFDTADMTPAAGQGTLVVQTRAGQEAPVEKVGDRAALTCLLVERAAVVELEADCDSPVGIHATLEGDWLTVDGFAGRADGSIWVRDRVEGDSSRPEALGRELAERMLSAGAREAMSGSTPGGEA